MSTAFETGATSVARTTPATTSAPAAPSTTMMTILDKYASLNRHIDEAREETLHIQDRIDQIHTRLDDTQRDREQMNRDIQQARVDSQNLHQECHQLQKETVHIRVDSLPLDSSLTTVIRDHQRDFLHQSQQFRQTLRRLHLTAADLGLDRAPSHAWLELNGTLMTMEEDDESKNDARENDEITNTILEQQWHQEALTCTLTSSNVRRETATNDDFQMEQALEAYNKAWTKGGTTTAFLHTMVLTHEKAQARSKARHASHEQLRAQLDRLCRDTTTLEEQLRDLRQETHIVEGMEESFRQRAAHNAVVRRPQNPYSSPSTAASTTTTTPCTATTRLQQRPPMVTEDRQEQFPHLAQQYQPRRRYVDRQFQTTIGVITTTGSTMDDDSDDDILSFAPFQK